MCGRVTLRSDINAVGEEFGIRGEHALHGFKPSYNLSPGRDVLAVVGNGGNRLAFFRWGLVPSWAEDPSIGNRLINARAETLPAKPAFRDAFLNRRCLVVSDGFYEWKKERGRSIPFFISMRDGRPFGLAGLYEHWRAPDGGDLDTCTVITTEANELLSPIHNRMPAIIPAAERDAWLDAGMKDPEALLALLRPFATEGMEAYQVSSFVNSAVHDSPECIRPLKG